VSASLSAVLAQRLVRLIHGDCQGNGCEDCHKTGLRGRTGLFELMVVNDSIRTQISNGASLAELRVEAKASGLHTLREEGQRLVSEGLTTQAEAQRVVEGAE
ncbi:MAG: type II secretion system protein GspE, partial [Planctomycetes bacterium]|nr:type II secretion system protein GspE [Planctomycetota bacterium]